MGEHFLGRNGTIEHVAGANDMVTGRSRSAVNYYPEKINSAGATAIEGQSQGVHHMQNWMDCIRSRSKKTNAPVEIGYLSAVAAHMSNLSYRSQRRVTLEEAMNAQQGY